MKAVAGREQEFLTIFKQQLQEQMKTNAADSPDSVTE
jgi:hypothetical protein